MTRHPEFGERRQVSEEEPLGQLEGDPGRLGGGDLGRGAARGDAALVEYRQPVGQCLGLLQVVRGHQHGGAFLAQGAHQVPGVAAALGVQSGRGLVEEQHLGAAEQGEPQVQSALLAAGELFHPDRGAPGQSDHVQNLRGGPGAAGAAGPQPYRLGDRQLVGEAALLEHDARPRTDGGALGVRIVAEYAYAAGRRGRQALEEFDGGRLARAVGAEEREEFAAAHREGDAAHRFEPAPVDPPHVGDVNHFFALVRVHASSLPAVGPRGQCEVS